MGILVSKHVLNAHGLWGETPECPTCVQEMVAWTVAQAPLAILCFGFAQVFKHFWHFLPEGVLDV